MARFIDELKRTHLCGDLRAENVGQSVVLFGWVQSRRDHGGCIFVDLRDRTGVVQVVFDPSVDNSCFELGDAARGEWVLGIHGKVRSRGDMKNPRLGTGDIEVVAIEATVFNKSDTPPFAIEDNIDTGEEKRLEHRYLDLRRPSLQKNLIARSKIMGETRQHFNGHGFLEVETPMMHPIPGGAAATQCEQPYFDTELIKTIYQSAKALTKNPAYYYANIPTYPGGGIGFMYVSDTPWTNGLNTPYPSGENKYLNPEIHKAAFALPEFFRKELYK